MIKVLFTGKEHRERRRETILNPPKGVKFLTLFPIKEMRKDYHLTNPNKKENKFKKIVNIVKYNNFISKKKLEGVDLIYSPGHLILNKFPFVVEIDNVSVLSYYNLFTLNFLKFFIKKRLRSKYCKRIICISEAARNSVNNYFKDEIIRGKTTVIHPYIKRVLKKRAYNRKKTVFLFISSNFYLKGGREIINAFNKLEKKHENIKLLIITKKKDLNKQELKNIERSKNVVLEEPNKSKDVLLKEYYSNADVFVLPTYQDSFGMVFLEAISAGLPVISTKMFAVPEMVIDGQNGFLCDSPIPYFSKDFLPNKTWWSKDKVSYIKNKNFPEVERFLAEKMEIFIKNKSLARKMGNKSLELANEKFDEEKRNKKLGRIIGNSIGI